MAEHSVESVIVVLCQESTLAWVGAFEIPGLRSLPLTVSVIGSIPTDYADDLPQKILWFRHRLGAHLQRSFFKHDGQSKSHISHLVFVIDNTLGESMEVTQAAAEHLVQIFINPPSSSYILGVSFDEFLESPTEPKLIAGTFPEQFAPLLKDQIRRLIELTLEPDQWKIV